MDTDVQVPGCAPWGMTAPCRHQQDGGAACGGGQALPPEMPLCSGQTIKGGEK